MLVIFDNLAKIIHYKPSNTTTNATPQVEIINNNIIRHYSLSKSIINNRNLLYILQFWLLL